MPLFYNWNHIVWYQCTSWRTPAGNYSLVYQICEILNPTNCDTATVGVTVTTAIDAVADAGTPINGFTGGTAFTCIGDTLNNAL
jgi:hypothetical protein